MEKVVVADESQQWILGYRLIPTEENPSNALYLRLQKAGILLPFPIDEVGRILTFVNLPSQPTQMSYQFSSAPSSVSER